MCWTPLYVSKHK